MCECLGLRIPHARKLTAMMPRLFRRKQTRGRASAEEHRPDVPAYVPNQQLSVLVSRTLCAVSFVYDYRIELWFEQTDSTDAGAVLECKVWPIIERDGRSWREPDAGYGDALRALSGGIVVATAEQTGLGLRIEFDTGTVILHPALEDVFLEIAVLRGLKDELVMVWQPGGVSFEDLVPTATDDPEPRA